ncbi:unnamed protein product [Caretta caretta]
MPSKFSYLAIYWLFWIQSSHQPEATSISHPAQGYKSLPFQDKLEFGTWFFHVLQVPLHTQASDDIRNTTSNGEKDNGKGKLQSPETVTQTSEDAPQRVFKTINDLIYAYEKPNQGLIINLRYPVRRLKSPRKAKVEMDEVYDEIEDGDYVDVLP